jgi:hypothetical protein
MRTISNAKGRSSISARRNRGSVMITALVFALIIAISLASYIQLSTTSLRLSNRTFYADSAGNVAEAGLEEAVWMFNRMGSSSDTGLNTSLWQSKGWTCENKIADVYMESMGSGYESVPTVTFSGGGGTGAAGIAIVGTRERVNPVDGTVTVLKSVLAIKITNPGSDYTTPPAITLSGGGGGTGAVGRARFAATRTIGFNDLSANATGTAKVWVAGYDGTSPAPIIVSKGTVALRDGSPVEKIVKVIVSKNGVMPKIGVVAKYKIEWNGHPDADSFISSTVPGVPPFSPYNPVTARANTTVASLYGPTVDLAHGTVEGNVMVGPGVTVTGGTVSGQKSSTFSYDFAMPTYPVNSGAQAGYTLTSVPANLPRVGDVPNPADGNYYYYITDNNKTIENVTIAATAKVVITGTNNTKMAGNVNVATSGTSVGSLKIYIDDVIDPGNSSVNTTSWAGALQVWSTTTGNCRFSGNASFYGCIFAPSATLVGNGGGSDSVDMCGSFVVGKVTSNGHMCFHWDEGLGTTTGATPWALALWAELQSAADRALYASQLNF